MATTKVASLVVAAVGIWFGPSYRDVAGGALSSWGGGSDAPASRSSRPALFDEEPSDEDGSSGPGAEAYALDICPALPVAQMPVARHRLGEMAYSDDYSLHGMAAYLLATHAW